MAQLHQLQQTVDIRGCNELECSYPALVVAERRLAFANAYLLHMSREHAHAASEVRLPDAQRSPPLHQKTAKRDRF